jgi:hypothetical protein
MQEDVIFMQSTEYNLIQLARGKCLIISNNYYIVSESNLQRTTLSKAIVSPRWPTPAKEK